MQVMKFVIEQIWIDEDARDEPLTQRIVSKLPSAKIFEGNDCADRLRELNLKPDPLSQGKKVLRLMKHKGVFVKPCPGTPNYVCCGLEILHIGQGCPMDCRYCALQVYFNRPVLEVFVNTADMMGALQDHLERDSQRFHRICTGEFTDSLALDPLTGLSPRLVDFFSKRTDASLEIKTKTDSIDPLLDLDPCGRVILSFSVNAAPVVRQEEKRAATLEKRLAAAARAQRSGYGVGLHFDPIIPIPGWETEYCRTVDAIFDRVDSSSVVWISLGVLRFAPELKRIAGYRFGPIKYFHDGFLIGLDGKSRLQTDRRVEIYRRIIERIRLHAPETAVYFCMESEYVWEKALGIKMRSDEDLIAYLDAAAKRIRSIG
jgi:spore photoproduct lyase